MEASERFKNFLRERGLTFTSTRNAILGGIVASEGHFDAAELHDLLKRKGETLSAATIYRALPLFVRSGIIRETLRAGGRSRYEHALGHDHHDHLECIACGRIIEFKDDELEKLQEKVCRKNGFTAVEHRLGIRGYCAACRTKRTR
jgi:Fur family transcriptional regulator, ferric uptake regulator